MGDDSSASIPPELQVVMDLEVTVKGLTAATEHQRLQAALVSVPGVSSVSIWENKVEIRYEPQRVTRHHLHDLIVAEGFTIADEAGAPPTPSVDSH